MKQVPVPVFLIKKVLNLTMGKSDRALQTYCFRSLYHLDRREESMALMKDYLQKDGMFLIYLRGYFEEFMDDETIKELLVNTRSKEQYQKMEESLKEGQEFRKQFKIAASNIKTYYENKTTQHIKTNVLKDGIVINEVKFE